jgi:dUTP pyrophosphatase
MYVRLNKFRQGKVLKHAHVEDAGWDVFVENYEQLHPGETKMLPLGFGIDITPGNMGVIMPRTSMSLKGLLVHSCPIDAGYKGEIHAIVTNVGDQIIELPKTMAIAQLVIVPIAIPCWMHGHRIWDDSKRPDDDKAFYGGTIAPRGISGFGSSNEKMPMVDVKPDQLGLCDDCGCPCDCPNSGSCDMGVENTCPDLQK